MKTKIKICLAFMLLVMFNLSFVFGQMMPYGESGYLPEPPDFYAPPLVADPNSQALLLPNEVDNSQHIYFPKIDNTNDNYLYNQHYSGSCSFASTIWYLYTYEANRMRNISGNSPDTRYIHNSGWNHYNGGVYSNGSSFSMAFGFLMQHGAINETDWGNTDPQDYIRWLHGNNKYNHGLKNKISGYSSIKVYNNAEGLSLLKHYLYDHNSASEVGGLMVIGLNFGGTHDTLPTPSNHAGDVVTTSLGGCGHAITIVGYCDDIKYDFNGDGLFTNNIDLNNDGVVDIRDWEIGGLKLVNSYGNGNGTRGFWWLPYRFLDEKYAYKIDVVENDPEVVLRTEIQHDVRRFLYLGSGYAELANADPPSLNQFESYEFIQFKGSDFPMKGNKYPSPDLDYDPIEMELEFSGNHPGADIGKAFLLVFCQATLPEGTLNKFSLVDYRWNETFELPYGQENMPIQQGLQYFSIEYDLIPHESPMATDITFGTNMVSRFNPTMTNNSTMEIGDGVRIDMYNSHIIIEAGSKLKIGENATFLAKRGVNRIIIRGDFELEENVSFIAEEGAYLFIQFENTASSIVVNRGYFERTNLNISCLNLEMINSMVLSDEENRIFVDRGATLNVNNSHFSSISNYLWRGIEVWGNSEINQQPFSHQGVIRITNGGIIENAVCGIRTWKPEALPEGGTGLDPDKDYFGGIIIAENAIFKNNKVAVEFMPYEFFNFSNFQKCTFETTAALLKGELPDYFAKLDDVNGIYFSGCDFRNTYNGYSTVVERGGGIYAIESDVIVEHICTSPGIPCLDFRASTFSGLYRGIYALGIEKQRTVTIQNSEFSNTVRGIYLSSHDFANVNLNHFQAWNEDAIGSVPIGYSLYLDACTGFIVEQNQFINIESSRRGTGLIVNESGRDNNQIYNNYFEKLNYGTIAQGYNRSGGSTTTGLCYKCNDFANNDYDIKIVPRNPGWTSTSDGIAYYQGANIPGNNLAPAGNTFTTTTNLKDIGSSCNWIIYYRHQIGPVSLLPTPADLTTNYQVFGTTYTKSESCPPRFSTEKEKEEVKLALESASAEAEATQIALFSVVDGGSTPELQSEVITSIPDEGMELRDQLLTESPYLSDTVLKTSIEKENVLNNAMIRDVLVANPQSAKSVQMVEMLDERVNPMTDEMKNEILSGQIITSEKEDLEAVLSFMKQEAWYNFGALCRLYAIDTLHTWSSDTIGVLFANETSLESQYKLAFWHLFKGNTSSATQVMSSIPGTFTLDAPELAQHERYSLLLNTLILLSNDPEVVLEAGTDVANTLTQLNTMSEDKPAAMSRNLLIAAGLMSYDEPIKLDDVLKTMPVYNPSIKGNESSKLRVYPNPANDFITIAWNTPDNSNLLLTLTDANGRTVHQQQLNGQNNETILNVSGFVNGTYQLRLSAGKKNVATETVVIQK